MLVRPSGAISEVIQGLWTASVDDNLAVPIVKPLYSDAGSGIVFVLNGEVKLDDALLPVGANFTPMSKKSTSISLSPGAQLAGIRFHPAVGFSLFGRHHNKPKLLSNLGILASELNELSRALGEVKDCKSRIELLNQFAYDLFDIASKVPPVLRQALKTIPECDSFAQVTKPLPLSQRQLERQFKHWVALSPKQYQRIVRVKSAIAFLRQRSDIPLSAVAQQFGFSDQAHMTREFCAIALTTPRKL